MIWYNLYRGTLEKEGFLLNPYYYCTANKMINVKQCTIQWYVDENKVTNFSEDVITGVIDIMKKCLDIWSCIAERNITFLAWKYNYIRMER